MPLLSPRLKNHTIALMIGTALFYDLLSLLIPTLVSVFQVLHFGLWFWLHGIKFTSPKRVLTGTASFFLEVFPLTSWLPACTLAVAVVIMDAKRKEEGNI